MCAHTVRVALNKIDGVESAEVSLNRGEAVVRFKRENRVTIEQIRTAIRSNGFTPKAAEVRVRGRVVEEKGELTLSVPGQDETYRLLADPAVPDAVTRVRHAAGQDVVIEGTVPETAKGQSRPETVQVRALSPP